MAQVTRIFDIPRYQLEKFNLKKALTSKVDGEWISISSQEYVDKTNQMSRGLLTLGVKSNDKIAVISSTNRTEWHILDIGILQLGAQNVPIYPTISSEDYEYILNHSESIYCFVSDSEILTKINAIKKNVPTLKGVYSFDHIKGCAHWKEVLELGKDKELQLKVEKAMAKVKPEDLATIIYTSGTTGVPKGVMLSHHNIVSNVQDSMCRLPFNDSKVALSFLPICHIFERMVLYLYQYSGTSVYFAENLEKISANLQEIRPHVMTVVPRLLEKVFDKIYARGRELKGIKKFLFFWAVRLAEEFEPYGTKGSWYENRLKLARKLIFSKWKAALGGNLELMVSGSAALQQRLSRIFGAADMPVLEGYGLTETSPVISVNDVRDYGWKIGTVGKIIPNVDIKIAEDGEILCKGPNVMMGYYKDPELTATVMTGSYFHTGDIGEIDKEGFLKITDRKKEMFKTSGGKYIAPQILENQLKQSQFIDQIMVIGDGEKMPAALIQPNFDFVREWANRHSIEVGTSHKDLISNPKVKQRIQEEIDHYNQHFGQWEQIKKFALTPEAWSVEGGHLTPTMKLRRKVVKQIYSQLYNEIYEH